MKRELGIARCGLACCLCSENETCSGCDSGECPDKDRCENRTCSLERDLKHCFECEENCRRGLLSKIKPYAFTLFIKNTGKKRCWIVWKEMNAMGLFTTDRGFMEIMMILRM